LNSQAHPLCIGANIRETGELENYKSGLIGAVIYVNGAMTAANIAKVAGELIALRKYAEAI
jgi:hypothetical protein